MIYRPVPITEAKASTIDARLKDKILADRRTAGAKAAGPPSDLGFLPAEGKREAIKRHISYLEKLRVCLAARLPAVSYDPVPGAATDSEVIDPTT